jgi:hypothetical protein
MDIMLDNQKEQDVKRVGVAGKHLKTYVHLFKVAKLALQRAQKDTDENFYDSMSCVLFCALCLEAYLNHVGATEFQFWEDDLESLTPRAKLRLIASERLKTEAELPQGFSLKRMPIKISIDFSRRPFQSFIDIFRVRNELAHGKTQLLLEKTPNDPKANWEKFCTAQQAKRLLNDTEKMIRIIHSEIYDTAQDPFSSDLKFFGAVTVSNE